MGHYFSEERKRVKGNNTCFNKSFFYHSAKSYVQENSGCWIKDQNRLNRRWSGQRVNLKTEVTRKQSTSNFPDNEHFSPPNTHVFKSGSKKCLLFGKFGVLCFLVTSGLRFAILPYHRRKKGEISAKWY